MNYSSWSIQDQRYFVNLKRTSLSKSGTNFAPIQNVQYFGVKMDHEIQFMVHLEFRQNIKMLVVPTNNNSDQKYFVHLKRTLLSKSGTNFAPIQNVQYFDDHQLQFNLYLSILSLSFYTLAIVMQGCYMEVVILILPLTVPSQSCLYAFSVLISLHVLSFFVNVFITLIQQSTSELIVWECNTSI